jgi:membrane-bound lytic murein transglycosylase B
MYTILQLLVLLVFAIVLTVGGTKQANARSELFQNWIQALEKEALSEGISKNTFNRAFEKVDEPIERIIELDRKQPEGTITFEQYKKRVITAARIEQGRHLFKKHAKLLQTIAHQYNVQPQYIVALWGIETSYGNNTGGFDVVPALATLAYDGRRSDFFRSELIDALRILEEGHVSTNNMKGSWAGAMGQNQFMPSSFYRFAIDGNGDGKRDIWTSLPDVFSSTANYLSQSGWKGDERWGRRVILPKDFDNSYVGLRVKHDLKIWDNKGVRLLDGKNIPVVEGMTASIVAPDGIGGLTYLVYDNYHVIMKWNKSTYFASCVGLLADQIVQ